MGLKPFSPAGKYQLYPFLCDFNFWLESLDLPGKFLDFLVTVPQLLSLTHPHVLQVLVLMGRGHNKETFLVSFPVRRFVFLFPWCPLTLPRYMASTSAVLLWAIPSYSRLTSSMIPSMFRSLWLSMDRITSTLPTTVCSWDSSCRENQIRDFNSPCGHSRSL